VTLYVANQAGGKARKLVGRVDSKDTNRPVWSPDGSRLLIEREHGEDYASIFVVDAQGGALARLATHTDYPDWSPEGDKVAYVKLLGTSAGLSVVSATGGASRRLVGGPVWNVEW
jgi:Tol biopolymer transport system component